MWGLLSSAQRSLLNQLQLSPAQSSFCFWKQGHSSIASHSPLSATAFDNSRRDFEWSAAAAELTTEGEEDDGIDSYDDGDLFDDGSNGKRPSVFSFKERGDQFELLAERVFGEVGRFVLRRVGGKDDGGIDLQGTFEQSVKIVAQCKHSKHRVSPKLVREFEGAMQGHADDDIATELLASSSADVDAVNDLASKHLLAEQDGALLGLYISSCGYTRQAMDYFEHKSSRPLAASVVDPDTGALVSFLFNSHAHRLFRERNCKLVLGFSYRRLSLESNSIAKVISSVRLAPLI